jgi:hypothetical protein
MECPLIEEYAASAGGMEAATGSIVRSNEAVSSMSAA